MSHIIVLGARRAGPPPPPPFKPVSREYAGQMCGVHVQGLPPVSGGAPDPTLVLSWFYGRYNAADRKRIRETWKG